MENLGLSFDLSSGEKWGGNDVKPSVSPFAPGTLDVDLENEFNINHRNGSQDKAFPLKTPPHPVRTPPAVPYQTLAGSDPVTEHPAFESIQKGTTNGVAFVFDGKEKKFSFGSGSYKLRRSPGGKKKNRKSKTTGSQNRTDTATTYNSRVKSAFDPEREFGTSEVEPKSGNLASDTKKQYFRENIGSNLSAKLKEAPVYSVYSTDGESSDIEMKDANSIDSDNELDTVTADENDISTKRASNEIDLIDDDDEFESVASDVIVADESLGSDAEDRDCQNSKEAAFTSVTSSDRDVSSSQDRFIGESKAESFSMGSTGVSPQQQRRTRRNRGRKNINRQTITRNSSSVIAPGIRSRINKTVEVPTRPLRPDIPPPEPPQNNIKQRVTEFADVSPIKQDQDINMLEAFRKKMEKWEAELKVVNDNSVSTENEPEPDGRGHEKPFSLGISDGFNPPKRKGKRSSIGRRKNRGKDMRSHKVKSNTKSKPVATASSSQSVFQDNNNTHKSKIPDDPTRKLKQSFTFAVAADDFKNLTSESKDPNVYVRNQVKTSVTSDNGSDQNQNDPSYQVREIIERCVCMSQLGRFHDVLHDCEKICKYIATFHWFRDRKITMKELYKIYKLMLTVL